MSASPRPEYPRPRLVRERWESLNGPWRFAFDDADNGVADGWHRLTAASLEAGPLDRSITVPFAYQSERSGIGDPAAHDIVWYGRTFTDPRKDRSERLLLHFGAVDYRAQVWVDGTQVATHTGGHTSFSADVGDALVGDGPHALVVRAYDPFEDLTIPRGKQFWQTPSEGIFYTATTGIWQSVWLEPVPAAHVRQVHLTPDLAAGVVDVDLGVSQAAVGATARVHVTLDGRTLVDDHLFVTGPRLHRRVSVVPPQGAVGANAGNHQGVAAWTPERPVLHDVEIQLVGADGVAGDRVDSYVGMRDVQVVDGEVRLNGRPYYQRLVLDQGYFPGGGLTALSDDDLRRDIELAKELGFNGARKHQKIEDPRWLYWADRLGFLVWEEMPSAYRFSPEAVQRITAEWAEAVERDRDHPCILAWVPMNESWGTPNLTDDPRQRAHLQALYHLTHTLDGSRPVVSNDGWEHAISDLLTIHHYGSAEKLAAHLGSVVDAVAAQPAGRAIYTTGHHHRGEPLLLTEFGGVAVAPDAETWGYDSVADGESLGRAYDDLLRAVVANPAIRGFCYTQLTDIEQEANGLLTFDRKPKTDVEALLRATTQPDQRGP